MATPTGPRSFHSLSLAFSGLWGRLSPLTPAAIRRPGDLPGPGSPESPSFQMKGSKGV